jgi:hypothetical protein
LDAKRRISEDDVKCAASFMQLSRPSQFIQAFSNTSRPSTSLLRAVLVSLYYRTCCDTLKCQPCGRRQRLRSSPGPMSCRSCRPGRGLVLVEFGGGDGHTSQSNAVVPCFLDAIVSRR